MAVKYRKVYQHAWTDQKFRCLSPAGKLIALHLLTGAANRVGIFAVSLGQVAEQTGLAYDFGPPYG